MTLSDRARLAGLDPLGQAQDGGAVIHLFGPHPVRFWPLFAASDEFSDGAADPLDRWSKRVIGQLAADVGGAAIFPSDGPPYPPFLDWAQKTGQAWISPVGLMIHARAGLWLSFRGAIRVAGQRDDADVNHSPCATCAQKPCQSACPFDAMAGDGYDVAKCHAWLDGADGDCMAAGCAIRRACPVSQSYGRVKAQSAFHMKAFHTP